MKIFFRVVISLGLIISLVSGVVIYQLHKFSKTQVIFLNIGQGDSILLAEGDYQVLIDGGSDGKLLQEKLSRYMPFWDRTIDVVIATHLDDDHVSGLVDVLKNYKIHEFWYSNIEKDTDTARALKFFINKFGIQTHEPIYGDKISFASGANFSVAYPIIRDEFYRNLTDANQTSIAGIFQVGQEKFFLGGDLPKEIEDRLNLDQSITVLKAGHHGSRTSTSELFLDRIRPRDAIISAGKDNKYGHPHKEVIQNLIKHNVDMFKTYQNGTIIYSCLDKCKISFGL